MVSMFGRGFDSRQLHNQAENNHPCKGVFALSKPLKTCFNKVYVKAKKPCEAWWLFSICRIRIKTSLKSLPPERRCREGARGRKKTREFLNNMYFNMYLNTYYLKFNANDPQKNGRKQHPQPYKNRRHKLCRDYSLGIYPETEMEKKAETGGKIVPGQDHHPRLERLNQSSPLNALCNKL
jgi:hypothetical protein